MSSDHNRSAKKTEVAPGSLLYAVLKKPGAQISTNLKFTGWNGLRSTHTLFFRIPMHPSKSMAGSLAVVE